MKKYFDFNKFYAEEIKDCVESHINCIDDDLIELHEITKETAKESIKNPPFPLYLDECEIDFERQLIIIDFSEEYNNSTEAGTDISFSRFYIVYSVKEEMIIILGEEQG